MQRPSVPLQRETLVRLALEIADREGVEAASFRRLARELGATPMALYWHVRDRDDLLDAAADLVLTEVELPRRRRRANWVAGLRGMMRSFVAARQRHPSSAVLLQRPLQTQHAMLLLEASLDLLRQAGFEAPVAIRIVQQLSALLTAAPASLMPPDGGSSMRVPASDQFPRLVEAMPFVTAWRDDARDREFGVELLIRGVQALLPVHASDSSDSVSSARMGRVRPERRRL